jgi:hypothetical protein
LTKGNTVNKFKRGYGLKAAGLLLVMGAIAAALFLGPALRPAPELGPPMQLPAMSNIPPEGSLHIETDREAAKPPAEVE